MIKIRCFGVAKEITSTDHIQLEGESMSITELRKSIEELYADFNTIKGYMVAVNQEYATDDMFATEKDEVAIIPPVSGG